MKFKYSINNNEDDIREYEINNLYTRSQQSFKIHQRIDSIKEHLKIRDAGLTVYYDPKNKELSEGCKACKSGQWWCLFVGHDCNAACKYCPQCKNKNEMKKWDARDTIAPYWIEDVKAYSVLLSSIIRGISYSGGEPFMYLDKIYEISEFLSRSSKPYQWVYTNGILANSENMKKLRSFDVKEIRFDLAATNFSQEIIKKLKIASKIFERVTVEVPSMNETRDFFINNNGLQILEDSGVTQLNLAELQLIEDINFKTYAVNQDIYDFDTIRSSVASPCYSRMFTLDIIEKAIQDKSNLVINDCSNDTKHLQVVARTMMDSIINPH